MVERSWYDRSALDVAPQLLGARMTHLTGDGRVGGLIVETEAYAGPEDLAAHSARGRTRRNEVMFGPAGHAYVYLIYGLHNCMNVVCGPGGKPEAVLIRAIEIDDGIEIARRRRGPGVPDERLGAGPGNVCAALAIDRSLDGVDLLGDGPLAIAPADQPAASVARPRIGVGYAGEWASRPWRFVVPGSRHVSRR